MAHVTPQLSGSRPRRRHPVIRQDNHGIDDSANENEAGSTWRPRARPNSVSCSTRRTRTTRKWDDEAGRPTQIQFLKTHCFDNEPDGSGSGPGARVDVLLVAF